MEKVLITGGAGFIGNAIINNLHKKNKYEIIVLDNFSQQIHGSEYQKSYLYEGIKDKCEIFHGDVRNIEDWKKVLPEIDYVIHLAAETGTGQSMYEVNRYNEVNIMGLSNLFDILLKGNHKVKKIILSSSRSIYGEGMYKCQEHGIVVPESRQAEDMLNGDFEPKCPQCGGEIELVKTNENCISSPVSLYAFTKYAQEKMLEVMCPVLKIPYTIFRYQNVYGAGQSLKNPYTGILSIFSNLFLANKEINIFEDGLESRDFVHVEDVARTTLNALDNSKTDNEIINIGSGINTTVIQIANRLKELYQSSSEITITGDFRLGDIRHNIADINKAKELCGFETSYTFDEGIESFVNWVKEAHEQQSTEDNDSFQNSIGEMKNSGILFRGKVNEK